MAPPQLERSMGLVRATAMVVGIIIGASIFVQPTEISRHVPSIPGMMLVWLASGMLTFFGALVCADLASAFPETGGVYVFLRESVSPAAGFLWGWAMFWSMHSGIIAASAVVLARYVGYFTTLGDFGIRAVAIAAILALSGINYLGVRQGSVLQAAVTIAKLAAIVFILVMVFSLSAPRSTAQQTAAPVALREFVLAVSAGLFTFGGWHMVTYAAGETRDPARTIRRALLIGTLLVTACYLALNAACLRVLPLDRVIASTRVAADAAEVLVGQNGAAAISALVIVSSVSVVNGVILAGPRVYYAMANDGLAFRWMGAVHPRFHTPHAAILMQALWSSVLVATGTYRSLFTRVIYTEWLFFGLMTIGLLRRRRKTRHAALVPLLFAAGCAVVVANQVAADPRECAVGLLLVAAGWPVYYFWRRNAHH